MNTKRNLYLAILAIVTVVCIIVGITVHAVGQWGRVFRGSSELTEQTQSLADVQRMEIDLSVAELTVREGADYALTIRSSERLMPKVSLKNGTLSLTQSKQHNFWTPVKGEKCTLVITVPEGTVINDAQIAGNVGALSVSGVEFKNLSLETNVGACELRDVDVEALLTVSSNVGDVKFSGVTCEESEISLNVGGFDGREFGFDRCTIESDTGDVFLLAGDSETLTDYTVVLNNDVGAIHYFGESAKQHLERSGDPDKVLAIRSDVGDITVE